MTWKDLLFKDITFLCVLEGGCATENLCELVPFFHHVSPSN